MKKILYLFALSITLISICFNAKASYFTEDSFDEIASPSVYNADHFNVIKCCEVYFPEEIKVVERILKKGYISQTASVIDANNNMVGQLVSSFEKDDKKIIHIVELGGSIIYQANNYFSETDKEVITCDEIDLNEFFTLCSGGYHINLDDDLYFFADSNTSVGDYSEEEYLEMTYVDVRCKMVKKNTYYDNSKVYFVCNQEYPKDISFYKALITANDPTSGDVSESIRIINSNYPTSVNNLAVGTYSFQALASDECGNTAVQDFKIQVVDVTKPSVSNNVLYTSYEDTYSSVQILNSVTITDTNQIVEQKISEDTYFSNPRMPGEYYAIISAEDEYGNIGTGRVDIIVEDHKAPVITMPKSIYIKTSEESQMAEIKSKINVIDGAYGQITDFEPVDVDGYVENPNKIGSYKFTLEVYDGSNNRAEAEFMVYVTENDYPTISAGEYVIVVGQNERPSKEEIMDMLETMTGLDLSSASLSSTYFDSPNPTGDYPLMVSLSDGTVLCHTLRIASPLNEGSYENPVVAATKSVNYFLIGGIALAVVTFSVLGIVVYRKRH